MHIGCLFGFHKWVLTRIAACGERGRFVRTFVRRCEHCGKATH